jgi:hypothetical protein
VPVDLLKIRMQLQTAVRGAPGYIGPLALLGSVLRAEGLRGEPWHVSTLSTAKRLQHMHTMLAPLMCLKACACMSGLYTHNLQGCTAAQPSLASATSPAMACTLLCMKSQGLRSRNTFVC